MAEEISRIHGHPFLNFEFTDTGEMFLTEQLNGFPTCVDNTMKKASPKDIVRQTIRQNRKRKGLPMPVIEKFQVVQRRPKQTRKGENAEDLSLRREKNRKAAQKCRQRKKKNIEQLEQKVAKWKKKNMETENEIEKFKKERNQLSILLQQHKCSYQNSNHYKPNSQQSYPDSSGSAPETIADYDDDDVDSFTIEQFLDELPRF